ncbi:Peroxin-3 [Terfezia boudieri ATCC MYA-4762]|uniref:Peroxin-3 n=1 Tax=Terfezia boudieri ATCC MYA-4762 TaxID=1051890 RepID=A0A3N4LR71_9PEZI|nr:Peroxin-3 [Terfezia boudieri ATCC MYA-4762]
MFESVKNFVRRNRTNIVIGVGIAGGAYLYARSKVTEAKDRMSGDRRAKEYLKRRFEQNQEDCSVTVLELLPQAVDAIMKDLPVERITAELEKKKATKLARSGSNSGSVKGDPSSAADSPSPSPAPRNDDDNQSLQRKSRTQLWNEIKIKSITRAFTLIYTLALLTILTRVQLNLLGRKNYLSSVVSLSEREESPTINLVDTESASGKSYTQGVDAEVNRQYLIFSWWFLHRGWRRVREKVEAAVKEVFGQYTPRDSFTLQQLHQLTLEVRRRIEIDDGPKWPTTYLLPKPHEERIVFYEFGYVSPATMPGLEYTASPALRQMLDETSDLLDSPVAGVVIRTMLDSGFGLLVEERIGSQVFRKQAPVATAGVGGHSVGREGGSTVPRIEGKLSNVLAVMKREAAMIGGRAPNEYLQACFYCVERLRELEGFCALVYSNFEEDVMSRGMSS